MTASYKPIPDFDLSKLSFSVTVPGKTVLPSKMPVPRETTYAQFGEMGYPTAGDLGEGADDLSEFVYSHFQTTNGGAEFFFIKPRTVAEAFTPLAHLTYTETDYYPWPSVIEWIAAVEVKNQPIQFEVRGRRTDVPSLALRMSKLRGGDYPCIHKFEYFVSSFPFPESFFKTDVPIPGVIFAQIRNLTVDEFALHPEIELPAIERESILLTGFGYIPPSVSLKTPEILPATNHTRWREHVFKEHVEQINGLYVCVRQTVKPPRGRRKFEVIK